MIYKILKFSFVSFLLILYVFLSQYASDLSHFRSHNVLFLDDGTDEGLICEFSSITDLSKLNSNDETGTYQETLLISLGNYEKWIYTAVIVSSKKECLDLIEETYELLSTKERLRVKTFFSKDGKSVIKYVLISSPKPATEEVPIENVPQHKDSFNRFLIDNFSSSFLSSLEKLRRFVFLAYKKEVDFPISPSRFKPIWGTSPETDGNYVLSKFIGQESVSAKHFPIIVYYNCDFDAKFGYPCSPEEVPAKNPKVLVIEKKQ